MGQGYIYTCTECQYSYDVHPGMGMLYPMVYREKLAEIASGAYGEELKELVETTDNVAIDAGTEVFVCGSCNRWEEDIDTTLWVPIDPESIPDNTKTRWSSAYREEAEDPTPYFTSWDLKEYFHVLKRRYHICKACGRRMHKASEKELQHLSCPRCGTPNKANGFIDWD